MDEHVAALMVEKGAEQASVIPLDQGTHIIGKPPHASIPMDNHYVSRRHAQIALVDGRYQITDLGSKNGTYVNGIRMGNESRWLTDGDRIELGLDQVILRFQWQTNTLTLPAPSRQSTAPGIMMEVRSREVWVMGTQLRPYLSRKEFDGLELLYRRRGEVCSKNDLARHAWPERSDGDVGDHEIEQCVRRLRLRVEPDPSQPIYIQTIRGHGYQLAAE